MKLLVADDHVLIRRGLKQVLAEEFPQAEIQEVGTGQGVLEAVRAQGWDGLILDINLPDKNGIEVLKEVKALQPALPVLVLSLYPEEQYATRAFKAGADGYITKESAPHELVMAVKKALRGEKYVSNSFGQQLAIQLSAGHPLDLHQTLSDREHGVLRLLAQGKTATDIGDALALSVKTISTYRARILEKLHLETTAQLIRYAVDHKLVE